MTALASLSTTDCVRGFRLAPAPSPDDRARFRHALAHLPSRLAVKIAFVPTTSCWRWLGSIQSNGYGRCWDGRRSTYAHRVLFETLYFPIASKRDLDHLCRNRWCVNPDHLQPVTRSENLRRGLAGENVAILQRLKTHCPRGHIYDESNTRHANGRRHCRACARARYHRNKSRNESTDRYTTEIIAEQMQLLGGRAATQEQPAKAKREPVQTDIDDGNDPF